MLLVIILGAGLILGLWGARVDAKDGGSYVSHLPFNLQVGLGLAGAICLVIVVAVTTSNIGTVNDLEAFYESNAAVYSEAVDDIAAGVQPKLTDGVLFDAASLEQVDGYANAVVDRRDAVTRFNARLKTHRYWQDHGLVGFLIRNVGEEVTFLTTQTGTD